MKKLLSEEFKRMQKLAGINEIKIDPILKFDNMKQLIKYIGDADGNEEAKDAFDEYLETDDDEEYILNKVNNVIKKYPQFKNSNDLAEIFSLWYFGQDDETEEWISKLNTTDDIKKDIFFIK